MAAVHLRSFRSHKRRFHRYIRRLRSVLAQRPILIRCLLSILARRPIPIPCLLSILSRRPIPIPRLRSILDRRTILFLASAPSSLGGRSPSATVVSERLRCSSGSLHLGAVAVGEAGLLQVDSRVASLYLTGIDMALPSSYQ
ncbi:hypothetical protein U9M48_013033 [Paspalum notatum var. saurae]|uniref:Uncharacterized protein n=1 Tax=Paspalum notatum var. saurae TaxID=547442 RepID=A0AAQ3SYM0_PASNO